MTTKHVRIRAALLATAMSLSLLTLPVTIRTASAQIVYDPSNYAQKRHPGGSRAGADQ